MYSLYKLPESYSKRCIFQCCSDFRAATILRKIEMPSRLLKDHLLIRNIMVGVNASDLRYVSGIYRQGIEKQLSSNPGCGFEALGVVVGVSEACQNSHSWIGSIVLVSSYSAFSEYQVVRTSNCFKLPGNNITSPCSIDEFNRSASSIYKTYGRFLPLTLSGATALLSLSVAFRSLQSLSLGKSSPLHEQRSKESVYGLYGTNQCLNVLVTASAGSFGHLLTQLICHYMPASTILAVTSSTLKGEWVKKNCFGSKSKNGIVLCYETNSIGCQLAQYCSQKSVSPRTFHAGSLNMIFDSVGGKTLESAMHFASNKSVTMVIGSTSQYTSTNKPSVDCHDQTKEMSASSLSHALLSKSSSLVGFFLPHYTKHIASAVEHLVQLTLREEIFPQIDTNKNFEGLEDIPSAVEHLYSKQSCGKVVVRLI